MNNHIGCTQCGGIYGDRVPGASCDNINTCDRLIGIGERIDKWSVSSYAVLPNCVMPQDSKVTCRSAGEWPYCKCDYDISSNSYCNETNTVCEGDSSVCTVNFTKTNELPGGVCPPVNNTYKKSYDQKCSCDITRDYSPWIFTMEKCGGSNNKTSIGTRTRKITITKKRGNKACKIRPEINEQLLENTTGIENKDGYFQFKPEVDVVGGTFQTIQKEKDFNNMDDDSCFCEGDWSEWYDITTCPNRKDYTKLDTDFKKKQRRNIISNKRMYPNMSCLFEERTLACPRDCSGNVVYGTCKDIYDLPINCEENTSGLVQGTITNVFNLFKSKINGEDENGNIIQGLACPETKIIGCNLKCNVDCVGAWKDVGTCMVNKCDPSNNTVGLGKQRQEFVVQTYAQNEGKPCPGLTREVDCSLNNHIGCTQCGGIYGDRVPGASCDNINTCDGLIGIGERIDKWNVSSYAVLPNCIMPQDSKVTCRTAGEWPYCKCSYDISSNTYCNESNTVCTSANTNTCTVNYTERVQLPGGVCTEPKPKHYNVNLDKCKCTVTRKEEGWIYTNPRCDPSNRTTFIADARSRKVTITKTEGNKACTFPKLLNETILDTSENNVKGKLNPNGELQFGSTNDFNDATFQTVETENVNFPDNINCKCEGGPTNSDASYSEWGAWNNVCPVATNTTLPDSAFTILRTRTRTYKKTKQELTDGSCSQSADAFTKQTETVNCPRNCVGKWSDWGPCNTACPGNAASNNGTSTQTSGGGQATQTATYTISTTALGTGDICSNQNGDTKRQPCNTGVACIVNCIGGTWTDWTPCTALVCGPSSTETVGTKTGTQNRSWTGAIGPFNNGAACPAQQSQACSNTCKIDCKGGTWTPWTGCTAPSCGPSSTETVGTKTGTEYRSWTGATAEINNGAACPAPQSQTCSNTCKIDCKGGTWTDWTPCTAPACGPSSTETVGTKTGTQNRSWTGAIAEINNGAACPAPQSQTCSNTCKIDCKGAWDTNYSGCTAACGPASTETEPTRYGTEYKYYRKTSDPINNGAACPTQPEPHPCSKPCQIDCAGGWDPDSNNTLGLGWRRYKRRPNSNVGSCPSDNYTDTVNGGSQTGIPKNSGGTNKYIHPKDGWPANGWQIVYWDGASNENRLKWNFQSDGSIQSVHNTSLYLKPNSQQSGSDIVFGSNANNHRWRKRTDGKIEYMGSSNYSPKNLCIHTCSGFDNYNLACLKDCSEAKAIDLVAV